MPPPPGAGGRCSRPRPGIAHLVRGYRHYQANHGNHLAAAITYFSFLALFPLVLLGVSITAFVLAVPAGPAEPSCSTASPRNLPGGFGDTLQQAIDRPPSTSGPGSA